MTRFSQRIGAVPQSTSIQVDSMTSNCAIRYGTFSTIFMKTMKSTGCSLRLMLPNSLERFPLMKYHATVTMIVENGLRSTFRLALAWSL